MNSNRPLTLNLLHTILKSSLDGIFAFDTNCCFTVWNPATETMSGLSEKQILGRNAFEVFPFLRDTGADRYYYAALEGKTSLAINETYFVPETGKMGYFEAVYAPLFDDEKKIIGGTCVFRETTRRNLTEQKMKEAELRLNSVVNYVEDGIISCDQDGAILAWSDGASNIFRFTEQEAVGRNLDFIVPQERWGFHLKTFSQPIDVSLLQSSSLNFEHMGKRKDGADVPVRITLSCWMNGFNTFMTVIVKDMTYRKHIENAAEETEELYQALVSAQGDLNEGVTMVTMDTNRLLYVNDAFCKLTEYSRDELFALNDMKDLISPIHREFIDKRIAKNSLLDENGPTHLDLTLQTKSGNEVHVEIVAKEVETSTGPAIISITRDITKRKNTEAALEEERIRLKALSEATSEGIVFFENGIVIEASEQFAKIFGYDDPAEIIGKTPDELTAPSFRAAMRNRHETNEERAYKFIALKKDGSEFLAEATAKIFQYRGRQVRAGTLKDLSNSVQVTELPPHLRKVENFQEHSL